MRIWAQSGGGASLLEYIDVIGLTEALSAVGVTTLLILILIGGWRRWWVFGWAYREKYDECERWKALAMRSLVVSEDIASTVEKTAESIERDAERRR